MPVHYKYVKQIQDCCPLFLPHLWSRSYERSEESCYKHYKHAVHLTTNLSSSSTVSIVMCSQQHVQELSHYYKRLPQKRLPLICQEKKNPSCRDYYHWEEIATEEKNTLDVTSSADLYLTHLYCLGNSANALGRFSWIFVCCKLCEPF